jgi:hypothetical protein
MLNPQADGSGGCSIGATAQGTKILGHHFFTLSVCICVRALAYACVRPSDKINSITKF